MPKISLSESVLLPELELTGYYRYSLNLTLNAKKKERYDMEVCPKCATPSNTGYDKRKVRLKDSPIRNRSVTLVLTKRRFYCKPWPKTLGIDEHSFLRKQNYGRTEFASLICDYDNKRVYELVRGKTTQELCQALHHIKERENVPDSVLVTHPFRRH